MVARWYRFVNVRTNTSCMWIAFGTQSVCHSKDSSCRSTAKSYNYYGDRKESSSSCDGRNDCSSNGSSNLDGNNDGNGDSAATNDCTTTAATTAPILAMAGASPAATTFPMTAPAGSVGLG